MKLHRLELTGFGPFRDRQTVDFDAFDDDGIFLIGGRTGAGKSSILDGVCFALYGTVPRYESGEKRLRSDHCAPDDPTEVSLEFTVGGRRWQVTRSPDYQRPKRRGDGWTKVAATAQVSELVDGVWEGRASGARNVGELLDDVLQLSAQQFLQVILLAQNRFARFLLADSRDRQAVLRTLFDSRRFDEYERSLDERRKQAEQSLGQASGDLELLLGEAERIAAEHGFDHADGLEADRFAPDAGGADNAGADNAGADNAGADHDGADDVPAVDGSADADTPSRTRSTAERLADVERALLRARHRVEVLEHACATSESAHRAADDNHRARTALRSAQERRVKARAALEALREHTPDIDADRTRLERAARAEALRAPLELALRAERDLADARAAEDAARQAWARVAPDSAEADATGLQAVLDAVAGELALCAQATADEIALRAAETDAAAAAHAQREQRSAMSTLEGALAAFPEELARLNLRRDQLQADAAGLAPARTQLAALDERIAAAEEAARLEQQMRRAEQSHLERSRELDDASSAVTALLQRRLDGYAGELATRLIDGEPCAVCGSTAHPRPAHPSDDPVSGEDIERAQQRKQTAAIAERAAGEHAAAARVAHSEAAARAGGMPLEDLAGERVEAVAAVATAERAQSDLDQVDRERAELIQTEKLARAEHDSLGAALQSSRELVAAATATIDQLRGRVDTARGAFSSVAEREADAVTRRDAARSLAAALEACTAAATTHDRACFARDEHVAASDFADASEARSALLDAATRDTLDERIRAHRHAVEAELTRLRDLELELADAPDELVDPDQTAQAAEQARRAWLAAVDALATTGRIAQLLGDYVERARGAHAGIADLTAEHDAIVGLARTVAGGNEYRMTLETFVLAAELEQIVAAANLRLSDVSGGRYRLRHTDSRAARGAASGLGLEVIDAHTGQARPTQSLSGGETFLASLSLALGLAEVVTARAGGIRLDTLFIDEGFGALDSETLELAMRTLDELRQGGRTVGVISHVEAMKEDIPAQLLVEASSDGPSIVRQDALSPRR